MGELVNVLLLFTECVCVARRGDAEKVSAGSELRCCVNCVKRDYMRDRLKSISMPTRSGREGKKNVSRRVAMEVEEKEGKKTHPSALCPGSRILGIARD